MDARARKEDMTRESYGLESNPTDSQDVIHSQSHEERGLSAAVLLAATSIEAAEEAKMAAQNEFKTVSRNKQVLTNEQNATAMTDSLTGSREEYVAQLMAAEEKRKAAEQTAALLASRVNELRARHPEAQKRLTVVRLISMLDDLQVSLEKKVAEAPMEEEESRPQELLKVMRELSRERESALMLLLKKEREMTEAIRLKKQRIKDLRAESDRNVSRLQEYNECEWLGVTERIQLERMNLLGTIEELRTTNDRLSDVIRNTKMSATYQGRASALSADDAMGTSKDAEAEIHELRERMASAAAERQQLVDKTNMVRKQIKQDTERYTAKVDQMKREILFYERENSEIEKENAELQAVCESLALSLQQ